MAAQIKTEYSGKNPLLLPVLDGSFVFAADLIRHLDFECTVSFLKIKSYEGMKPGEKNQTLIGLNEEIANRHVLILEDIVDTGRTLHNLANSLQVQNPGSLKIASLLYKPNAAELAVKPDFTCFTIPNVFVVGYGLDYDGLGRNLPDIYAIKE